MVGFDELKKQKGLRLNDIIEFIRQKHVTYEVEGEMIKNGKDLIFNVLQKSTTAPNTREYIQSYTKCNLHFHTHPQFAIWPSYEDIMLVMKQNLKTSVIVTRMGVWLLKNKGFNNNKSGNLHYEYTKFFNFMNGYARYKLDQEKQLQNISKSELYKIDDNVIESIDIFSKKLSDKIFIRFFPIENNYKNSKSFKEKLSSSKPSHKNKTCNKSMVKIIS
tara:strand:- start:91 stop:744 length:654 start_codon:yes stop_codon:yes gene_type:complete